MWHSGYPFPKVSLPTQCEFPRGGTSRVTTVTLVPREGNETLRLFATPLHAWERLASSQKLTLLCAGVPLYLPSMPSHVTSWRNTNQDWNGFIHASDALSWGGSPKCRYRRSVSFPSRGTRVTVVTRDVFFSFLFLAPPPRLSWSRSQSALALIMTAPVSFWCWFVHYFTKFYVFLDYFVRLLCFAAILPALSLDYRLSVKSLSSTILSSLITLSPVECLTWSLPSLPVACGQWIVCLRAPPFGLYSVLWKSPLASLAETVRPLVQVKSASMFQFVSWVIFLFCECLIRLANNRLPEFVFGQYIFCFDMPLPLVSLCVVTVLLVTSILAHHF